MKYTKICQICKSDKRKAIFLYNKKILLKCKNCGVFYWSTEKTENESLENIKIYYDNIPDYYYDKINYSKRNIFFQHIRRTLKILNSGNKKLSLLDIGCSDGFFLELAKNFGFDVNGIEISDKAVLYAKEKRPEIANSIFYGDLKSANFPNEHFDVVTLWDVLDQMCDPNGEIKEVFRMMKRGGILLIRIRNAQIHLFLYRLRRFLQKIILSPATIHYYGFTRKSIIHLLFNNGFRFIKIYNSQLTIDDPYLQSKIGAKILNCLKTIYYYISQILYFISLGRFVISTSLIIYARK